MLITSHPPGPAWGSARSVLYPSLYCRVSSGFSLSPCTTGALAGHRVRPGGEDAVVGPQVVGLVVKVVAEEIDWHAPLERDPKGGKRHGEPKAEESDESEDDGAGERTTREWEDREVA